MLDVDTCLSLAHRFANRRFVHSIEQAESAEFRKQFKLSCDLQGEELFKRLEGTGNKTNKDEAGTPVAICFAPFNGSSLDIILQITIHTLNSEAKDIEGVLCDQENNSDEQDTENTSKSASPGSDLPKPLVICGTSGEISLKS